MRQVFVLARNRYNSGSSLYFVRGGSEIISSDAVQNGKSPEIINLLLSVIYCNLSLAGRQRLFRGEKYLSGTVRRRYVQGGFCLGTRYGPPGPILISRQAGMDGLSRVEKYLSGLYADGTFREVFVPEQDGYAPYHLFPHNHNFVAGHPMISC